MKSKFIENLEDVLGHSFSDPKLLQQALLHSSIARPRIKSNERLEFLGDRVLGLIIAKMLFEDFKEEKEGELGYRFAALAQRNTLSNIAKDIGLADILILSKNEIENGGRENPNILADTLEAVIAALYLDGGFSVTEKFVRTHWWPVMVKNIIPPKDPKTILQEWAQGRGLPLPEYKETNRHGPDHNPKFVFEVKVQGQKITHGEGVSKREAQQNAASLALENLGITNE